MIKEFTQWNSVKERIHEHGIQKLYHTREVWWCSLGVNVGAEQDGGGDAYRRPVLIVRGLGAETCLVVPLTASTRIHRLRIPVGMVDGKEATALISQIRVVDTKRLVRKIGYVQKETFEIIRKAARDML